MVVGEVQGQIDLVDAFYPLIDRLRSATVLVPVVDTGVEHGGRDLLREVHGHQQSGAGRERYLGDAGRRFVPAFEILDSVLGRIEPGNGGVGYESDGGTADRISSLTDALLQLYELLASVGDCGS